MNCMTLSKSMRNGDENRIITHEKRTEEFNLTDDMRQHVGNDPERVAGHKT